MNKKKIVALLVAGIMTMGVVGGTLAWFTSKDSVTNVFNTGATDNPADPDAGIKVEEEFPGDVNGDKVYDNPVLPGDTMVKEVRVESTANYDQFLRAKLVKNFYYGDDIVTHYAIKNDGTITYTKTGDDDHKLDLNLIVLDIAEAGTSGNTWSSLTGEYYYYNQILKAKGYIEEDGKPETDITSNLLKKVTLSSKAGDIYKNLTFKVELQAESVQASNGAAAASGWDTTVPAANIDGYKAVTP